MGDTITEAKILDDVLGQTSLTPAVASAFLEFHFSDEVKDRIRSLMDLNNRGTITDAERSELEKYLRVGQFVDLVQARARVCLAKANQG